MLGRLAKNLWAHRLFRLCTLAIRSRPLTTRLSPLRAICWKRVLGTCAAGAVIYVSRSGNLPVGQGGGDWSFNSNNLLLFYAAMEDDVDSIENLVNVGYDVNRRHPLGWCPIHVAAMRGCHKALSALLLHGADVNCTDHFAITFDQNVDRIYSLYEKVMVREEMFGANLNRHLRLKGATPLHYAALGNHLQTIKVLMEHNADPTVRNENGDLAIDYAQTQDAKDLLGDYAKRYGQMKEERERLERKKFPFEMRVKQRIVGQESAISAVAAAIRRRENGWVNDDHPLVFLFLGSSGIGKTELAKQVASYLHKDNKKAFIRLDMSEYQEKHEVAKFIGSPPGYVGHEDGGQLTKSLSECPNAVVLFDEVEKAHPDVLTILLQLFDEGRLTDGKGNTIDCKEAIFIMTSNLAAEEIANHALKLRQEAALIEQQRMNTKLSNGDDKADVRISKTFKENVVLPILKRHLKRDEFIGRITELVYFLPFSRSELLKLVASELEYWKAKAEKKHNIELVWDEEVMQLLADGYNVRYGARSIQHEVERLVVSQLAAAHERSIIQSGCRVTLMVECLLEEEGKRSLRLVVDKSDKVDKDSLLKRFQSLIKV